MKTKLLSLITASMLLSLSAQAAERFIALGYTSANADGEKSSGLDAEFGIKFGESFKQKLAVEFILLGKNDDAKDGTGNIMDFYYSLGYEILPSTTLSALVGYGYKSLGSVGSGRNRVTIYADGLLYGAEILYDINSYFDVALSYKKNILAYSGISYDTDRVNATLAFKF